MANDLVLRHDWTLPFQILHEGSTEPVTPSSHVVLVHLVWLTPSREGQYLRRPVMTADGEVWQIVALLSTAR